MVILLLAPWQLSAKVYEPDSDQLQELNKQLRELIKEEVDIRRRISQFTIDLMTVDKWMAQEGTPMQKEEGDIWDNSQWWQ